MKGKLTGLLLSTLLLMQNSYANARGVDDVCCDIPSCGLGSFEIGGEWLYWRADQDSMSYALHNTTDVEEDGITLESDHTAIRPKFNGKSGYRVFASYETADNCWKLGAIFTHAPSQASSSAISPTPVTPNDFIQVLPVNFSLLNVLVITSFSEVRAEWDLKVNYFDLDLQRNISLCQDLEIAPHVGFRALWIDEKFHWHGIDSTGAASHGIAKLKIDGYGIEGGLLGSWNVGYGFSLIGNIGGSLLYGRVNSHGFLNYIVGDFQVFDHYRDTIHRAIPMFDSFIGIQYSTLVCDYDIGVRVGWENHIFFDVNQFSLNKPGNLTMQGLTLGAWFGF